MKKLYLLLALMLFITASLALAEEKQNIDLTIYNQNFGLVKDRRAIELKNGLNEIRISDVASQIEPTSVHFKSLTAPLNCSIKEQDYEYDLVSADQLLKKYIDNKIKIVTKDDKSYEGALLSYDGENIVISSNGSISMVCRSNNIREISFPELPEGLITKPTLVWLISTDKPGSHTSEISYLTNGINWEADYVAVIDKDDSKIDLSGWVTINNTSGASYKDANLKLIAGEVHRAPKERTFEALDGMRMAKSANAPQFEEKSFFEYHMYTLQGKTTVKNNQSKQISLLSVSNVPIKKLYIYDSADYGYYYDSGAEAKDQRVKVKLELANRKENNLGMPLPKGKIKVYKNDTDGSEQFIGEDAINHTPKDEVIRLTLGEAFDVVGERKLTSQRQEGRMREESHEISLRNHKDSDIEVKVIERLPHYGTWKITDNSLQFTKKDAQTIEFSVPVAKNSENKVSYVVRYHW